MVQKKKLQIFVSSTYSDLLEERQAAVEAILEAGHIPAGMELFTAGDESQMKVIRQWIDDSDAYMLILGGRYGSIPKGSEKSYIHLEYEYALEKGRPTFAVVIDKQHLEEKVKEFGTEVIEIDHSEKMNEFRQELVDSQLVAFWGDPRDIQLAIFKKMNELSRREDLVGWVPGNQVVSGQVTEELARISKEKDELKEQIEKISAEENYNGLSYDLVYKLLSEENIDRSKIDAERRGVLLQVAESFGDKEPSLLHLFWALGWQLRNLERNFPSTQHGLYLLRKIERFGLVETISGSGWTLTMLGRLFFSRMEAELDGSVAREYMLTSDEFKV